jgi:hypothetical protein
MLLVIGRPGDARDNAEDRAESIVHPVYRVRHPTATASVPALAFQDRVEESLGA